jgi:hypothetical protein
VLSSQSRYSKESPDNNPNDLSRDAHSLPNPNKTSKVNHLYLCKKAVEYNIQKNKGESNAKAITRAD